MSDRIPEFTDTYSDDVLFLRSVRRSILRNPFEFHQPYLVDATISRLYAVMSVGNIENAIAEEHRRSGDSRLREYLRPRSSNAQKIHALKGFFGSTNPGVDEEVLDDYLAVKYMRNAIIHADQRGGEQAQHIVDRGFPVDSRDLGLGHLQRIADIDAAMIGYLGLSALARVFGSGTATVGRSLPRKRSVVRDEGITAPYSRADFVALHRRNLSNVRTTWNELAARTNPLPSVGAYAELARRIRTGVTGDAIGSSVAEWAASGAHSWSEIVRQTADPGGSRLAEDAHYRASTLQTARGAFRGSPDLRNPTALERYASAGRAAYDMSIGIPLDWVWPSLASDDIEAAVRTALAFLEIAELGRAWYQAVARQEAHDAQLFDTYRSLIEGLTR